MTLTERAAREGARALQLLADAEKCDRCKTSKPHDARRWSCRIDRRAKTVSVLCPSCRGSNARRATTNDDRRLRLREAELSLARLTR
jgi:hypothetical protein